MPENQDNDGGGGPLGSDPPIISGLGLGEAGTGVSSAPAGDTDRPRPDATKLQQLLSGPLDVRSIMLTGLFVLASLWVLREAQEIVVPMVLAVLLSIMLHPVISWAGRWLRFPAPLAAALLIVGLLLGLAGMAYTLSGPLNQWMQELPWEMREAEYKFRGLRERLEGLQEAGKQIEEMAEVQGEERGVEIRVEEPTLTRFVLDRTWVVAATSFLTVGLVYFLLAADDLFMVKLVRVIPKFKDKKTAVDIVRHVQHDIAQYILVITVINILLGVAVGLAMWLLGMPNAALWGVMAALLNFIPFLGAIFGVGVVALVAVTHFDSMQYALLVPATYYLLTTLEGSFVTPIVLGRRLVLNAVVVFLSLIFWGWMWGIPGIFLAVPVMSALKIICDNIEPLRAVGEFLGR